MACDLAILLYPQHSHPIGILGLICCFQIYPQEVKLPCDRCNPVQKQPQSQHVPSILLVPLDGPKLNCTGSVSFDLVFSRYHGLFQSSLYFNTNLGSIAASRILCSLIRLLRTTQNFPFGSLCHCYACD